MAAPTLIPAPQLYKELKGETTLQPETTIIFDAALKNEAELLAAQLRKPTGFKFELVEEKNAPKTPKSAIRLDIRDNLKKSEYALSADNGVVDIKGGDAAGVFYGTQTLMQLLPPAVVKKEKQDAKWSFNNCVVADSPRFQWRGMHLDESRHFMGKEFAKRYIDLISSHKMNVFHWHLIDDGGWRIEIKKYPKLAKLGGFRKGTSKGWAVTKLEMPTSEEQMKEGDWYGGYYTQEDIKEIVAYAKARHVRVIPEIEMPGHSLPALSTHEHLKCGGDLKDDGEGWTPSTQNSYCAGKEETFKFLEDVLLEVFELFPDEYVHIGGDEVIKKFWNQCPHCAKRMKDENLKDANELQSYFIKRMEKFINSKGKRLIGWDEITHGGLAPNATVMFWIGMGAVPKTAKKGHDIIMTPMNPCYFDFSYKGNSTQKVYEWEVIPQQLIGSDYEDQFLGSQGNVWTEWMETPERVEEMVLPRMLALAENLWLPRNKKNTSAFFDRLDRYYERLDNQGLTYYLPSPRSERSAVIFDEQAEVKFKPAPKGFELRYTIDGSEVKPDSPMYKNPIVLAENKTIRAAYVKGDRVSESMTVDCVRRPLFKLPPLEAGLVARHAEGKWKKVPDFSKLKDVQTYKTDGVDISKHKGKNHFACMFNGYLRIKKAGTYTFTVASDDGSYIKIAGAKVVDHDGPHSYSKKSGTVDLEVGTYTVEVGFLEVGGGERIDLWVTHPDGKEEKMDAKHFFRVPEQPEKK